MSSKTRLDQSLEKIAYIAKWMGISLEKREGFMTKYLFVYIFNFIWMNTDLVAASSWFILGVQKGESFASLTYQAPCLMVSFMSEIKSLCLIIYHDKVHELIVTLRNLENEEYLRERSREGDDVIRKETDFLHFIIKVLNFFNWAVIIFFPLMPLTLIIASYFKTGDFNPLLSFFIKYPFDVYNIRVWPLMYLKECWSETIVILNVLYADLFFFICSTYIRIQFRLLAFEVERLIPPAGPEHLTQDGTLETRIKDLVRWHQKVIYSVDLLEVIYCKSTLFNFVTSSALICLTGFNVITMKDLAFVVPFLSFLFMSLLQIYFLCFFGDMLMSSSEEVSDAVYKCKWYKVDKKAAKMLLIVQMRAQKACKLTACGFADVNYRAFTKILSTAWSYFALLKTVYSSPR